MKRGLLLLAILFVPLAYANTGWMFNTEKVELTHDIHQQIRVVRLSELSRLAYVKVNTSLVPRQTSRQKVLFQYSKPNATIENSMYLFKWRLPQDLLNFSIYSKIRNINLIKQVKKRVAFPLKEIPQEAKLFLGGTEKITSNDPEISRLASKLAQGEDDLYRLLFKVGVWVNENINYSNTMDVMNETRDATWVLVHRRGVCDEFSALFMAVCRSLGIPVRYVVGQAYSNLGKESWQNHGWVEAFVPGYGWIPFDPSFGEFGWVDNSHIEYYVSANLSILPTRLSYEGTDINVSIAKPRMKTEITSTSGHITPLYSISIKPFKQTVGFGSYNYITVTLNNSQGYYLSDYLQLQPTRGLSYMDSRRRYVLMRPKEVVREYFIVSVPSNISDRYSYSFPINVFTLRGYNASSSFQARKSFESFSYERIAAIVENLRKEEAESNKSLEKEIGLACVPPKGAVYENETKSFNCTVENRGNTILNNLKLCLEKKCNVFNLNIGKTKAFRFNYTFEVSGVKDLIFSAEGQGIAKSVYLSVKVLPLPRLEITKLSYPKSVSYKDKFQISFLVNNTVDSPVQNAFVNISSDYSMNGFQLSGFKQTRLVSISGRGKDLKLGDNGFVIVVYYQDLEDRVYNTIARIHIRLENLSFVQKLSVWFREFFSRLDSLFSKPQPQ